MTQEARGSRTALIVTAYPLVLIVIAIVLNLVLGIEPIVVALPSPEAITALTISGVLLLLNHTWLMTTTELTRARFNMTAAYEAGKPIPEFGQPELRRRRNAHRNTTENAIYFVFLALVLVMVSPPALVAQLWLIGFAVARLAYTYSYLIDHTGARGLFMTLSLISLYGMASYLALSLFL